MQPPLGLVFLSTLRMHHITSCHPLVFADWSVVQPLKYLAPFLKLVREPEVSGPITGVALTALWRLLSSGVLGELLIELVSV